MPRILVIFCMIFLAVSCQHEEEEQGYPCGYDMDSFDYSFGINYDNPELYKVPGEQSDIDSVYINQLIGQIGNTDLNLEGIAGVCNWFNRNFTFSDAGGSMIGQYDVNQLFEKKVFYGCHSAALVISSVLREFGFPVVMVETASLQWAMDYYEGKNVGFAGHVMSEVYVNGRWILLDNNGVYVSDYDYLIPFINCTNGISAIDYTGSLVIARGVDIWAYGVHSNEETLEKMIDLSNNLGCFEQWFGTVGYKWSTL